MTRLLKRSTLSLLAIPAALALAGCGESGVELTQNDPLYEGAVIFNERCAGCHTFDPAGAEGSATNVHDREYKDGPNFNDRKEEYEAVLYAIRNGGFSSGPMPQNIAVGREAELVACFVAVYSGKDASAPPTPGQEQPAGAGDENCRQMLGLTE